VGRPAYFDFFSVSASKQLILRTNGRPTNLTTVYDEPVCLAVTVQALSIETVSAERTFIVEWDGQWADDEKEMAEHLKVQDPSVQALHCASALRSKIT